MRYCRLRSSNRGLLHTDGMETNKSCGKLQTCQCALLPKTTSLNTSQQQTGQAKPSGQSRSSFLCTACRYCRGSWRQGDAHHTCLHPINVCSFFFLFSSVSNNRATHIRHTTTTPASKRAGCRAAWDRAGYTAPEAPELPGTPPPAPACLPACLSVCLCSSGSVVPGKATPAVSSP
ncbi:hypothetical protein VTK56DRAFT_2688 [Thermocarpiscus australiensis]